MNIDIVAKVINTWDPIDLLSHAPKDEYEVEVTLIVRLIEETRDLNELASGIQKIFIDRFGDDVFKQTYQDCLQVAKKILEIGKGTGY